MTKIVMIKPGASPPNSGDRVLIVRDPPTKTCTMTVWRDENVVHQSDGCALDDALSRAQSHARTLGIAAIYLLPSSTVKVRAGLGAVGRAARLSIGLARPYLGAPLAFASAARPI